MRTVKSTKKFDIPDEGDRRMISHVSKIFQKPNNTEISIERKDDKHIKIFASREGTHPYYTSPQKKKKNIFMSWNVPESIRPEAKDEYKSSTQPGKNAPLSTINKLYSMSQIEA